MSILPLESITELNNIYTRLCNSVKFREDEDFYTEYPSVFELSYNENPLGPGKLAREVIRRHADYAHRYPPLGYSILIDELARRLEIFPENILISAGSVTAIYHAIFQFANPGHKVIFSKSSMPWYRWSTIGNNSLPLEVPLMNDMDHDLEAILDQVDKNTKVVIISNPHNPTGLYINESDLQTFYSKLPESVLLIVDQAYYEYQTNQDKILINMINDVPNMMLTRTFPKIHGLAVLRVGYGMSNPRVIDALKAKWLGSMPTITSISTYAAYQALSDQEHVNRSREFNEDMKLSIYGLAEKYGIQYIPSEANFILLNIFDSAKNQKFFHDNNMAFTAGYSFGYPEWARISFDKRKKELLGKLENTFVAMRL